MGGGPRVKIPTRDLPRRVKLHRTQIYGLLMARRVFRILDGTAFEETLRDAVDQLLSHVQRAPRRGATVDPDTRLEDRFLYLPANPPRAMTPEVAESVDIMIDACAQLRECAIQYRKPNGASESLVVHPYAVVLYRDAIYCVCFVKERDAIRTLRVDRIVDADASPTRHFALPDDFSVDRHFAGHFGMHAGDAPVKVVVDFDKSVVELVRARTYPSEKIDSLAGGGVRIAMQTAITPELRAWILSFGDKARAIEPGSLAKELANDLRKAAAAYQRPPSHGARDGRPPRGKSAH
jgi:predicted DNA-binding transcriptional regulator YafY